MPIIPTRPRPLWLRLLRALIRITLWLAFALALLAMWTVLVEPRWVAHREIDLPKPDWRGPPGLKVAVASDWHIGQEALQRVMTVARANAIVDEINAARPDVILLPGDFMSGRGEDGTTPEKIAEVLGRLKAQRGVYAVLGNHDWWTDGPRFIRALRAAGITVLENEAVPLPLPTRRAPSDTAAAPPPARQPVWIVGIGDQVTGHADAPRALRRVSAKAQTLVLMHDPASARALPALDGLVVAGHTHGGQSWIPFYGSLVAPHGWPRDRTYGWVDVAPNRLYITSGLGVSIYPARFNMRPEWVMFTIGQAAEE